MEHTWMHARLEDGSPNPDHLPNWENSATLPEIVHVNLGGNVHKTQNGIHLSSWLRQGGQVVPDPDAPVVVEEAPHAAHGAHATKAKE